MSKIFIDTNILVYSCDLADIKKNKISREILKALEKKSTGVISTQVLQEFYVVATKKLTLEPFIAKELIKKFEVFETVSITPFFIHQAIDCQALHKISFWDALIVASASEAGCSEIYTEDLNHGQTIQGVLVKNPFF